MLIGRNNVGKTSAYAPLLVMRQTLDARDPATALLSRGSLIDIGNYEDFVYGHDVERDVSFRISLPDGSHRVPARRKPDEVAFTVSTKGSPTPWVRTHAIYENGRPITYRSRENAGEGFNFTSPLLPANTSVGRPLKEVSSLKEALTREQPRGFMFSGFEGLRLPVAWRQDPDRWAKVRPWFNSVNELYDFQHTASLMLERTLRSIAYLGPLRSLPQRTYRLAPERPADVGREGEFAPELLYRHRGTEVTAQVEKWLRELGYGSLLFEQAGDEYFQLYLQSKGGQKVNIAHSGVGVSQLLPILVQGFTAPREATFISQQPEIHLNPAQQSLIADFLIEASLGKRVIIETHSEHVLLRIRRRIAEGALSADEVAIYYFDSKDGSTIVRRVPLGDAGEVEREDWPVGFFEEQLEDSFALAAAQAKRG